MAKWAYEMSNEELVDAFANACAASGTANSGLVIDITGPAKASRACYFRGVLLARLEGQKPPFNLSDAVQTKSDKEVRAANHWRCGGVVSHDVQQRIRKIHYGGNGRWFLEFENIPEGEEGYPQFEAEKFVRVSAVAQAAGR